MSSNKTEVSLFLCASISVVLKQIYTGKSISFKFWDAYACSSDCVSSVAFAIFVFWRFFLCLRFFRRISNSVSFRSDGLKIGSSGKFKAIIHVFKSSLVITPSRCNCVRYSIFELIFSFYTIFFTKEKNIKNKYN